MRVLGVDPGLTRCGLGVVEGEPGPAAAPWSPSDVVRTPPDADIGAAPGRHRGGRRGLARRSTSPTPSPSSGSSASTTSAPSWARRRPARSRSSRPRARGLPVALHTPSEVKAAVTGSGRADKAQVAAMVTRLLRLDRAAQAGRRRRRPGAGDLPHLARRRPGPHRRGRSLASQAGGAPMIAVGDRTGRRARARAGRRRGRRRRHSPCSARPTTLADAAARRAGPARRPRSSSARTPSPSTASLDDDERQVFELLQTATGVGPRLAQAVLAVHTPDELRARRRHRRPRRPDPGARHRPQGRRSASCSSCKDRLGAPVGAVVSRTARLAGRRRRLARPGARRRCSASAGRPGRPTRPSRR